MNYILIACLGGGPDKCVDKLEIEQAQAGCGGHKEGICKCTFSHPDVPGADQ